MKISRLKNKKFIGLSKDFLLILAILDKISKRLKNDEKRLKIEKKVHFIDQKLLKIVKICLILLKFESNLLGETLRMPYILKYASNWRSLDWSPQVER